MGDVRNLLSENEDKFLDGGGLEESITILTRYRDTIGSNISFGLLVTFLTWVEQAQLTNKSQSCDIIFPKLDGVGPVDNRPSTD